MPPEMTHSAPPLVLNLADPAIIENPYPIYRRFQLEDPVHLMPNGAWFLTRYDHLAQVFRDDRRLIKDREKSLANYAPGAFQDFTRHTMMLMDPPDHMRVRGAFNPFFTPQAVAAWQGPLEAITAETLASLDGRTEFDFVADYATPVSAGVIAELFHLPKEDRRLLIRWGAGAVGALDPVAPPTAMADGDAAAREFTAYFAELIRERARAPLPNDMISELARSSQLIPEEAINNLAFLVVAGLEIAAILMGNGMHLLLTNPEACQRLCREPELMENAIEEFLRLSPPGHIIYRFAAGEIEVGGKAIPQGSYIVLCLAAAGRDPAVFEAPDTLDLDRPAKQNKHLSFAVGSRFCLGAHLARIETRIALSALLKQFPRLGLVKPAVKRRAVVFQGFRELIVSPRD